MSNTSTAIIDQVFEILYAEGAQTLGKLASRVQADSMDVLSALHTLQDMGRVEASRSGSETTWDVPKKVREANN